MENKFKFKDVRILLDKQTNELFLTVPSDRSSEVLVDTFVRDGKELRYSQTVFSIGCLTKYFPEEDEDRWTNFSRNSVIERLMGLSFDDSQEFTLDELKSLEAYLNVAHKQAYTDLFYVMEDGTGGLDCMKRGDLIFALSDSGDSDKGHYIFNESEGKYTLVQDAESTLSHRETKLVVTPTQMTTTTDEWPVLMPVSTTLREENAYGVFPNRSMYLDVAEYYKFTAEAYKRMEALKRQKEAERQNPSTKGE